MTERAEVLSIPTLDIRNNVSFQAEKISSFSEILQKEPYLTGERIVTVLDLDGVLCEYGEKNSSTNNLSRLLTLKNIISKSDEFIIYSSRINIDEESDLWKKILKPVFGGTSIVRCPFMVKSSMDRLESFAKKANPNCEFNSRVGFRKMRSCFTTEDNFSDLVEKTIKCGKKFVMIGSSVFDRQIVKQTVRGLNSKGIDTKNVYAYSTEHTLV